MPDTLAERERCKKILIKKIDYLIKRRTERRKKHLRKTTEFFSIAELEKIKTDFIFSVDNPDYKPTHNKLRHKRS